LQKTLYKNVYTYSASFATLPLFVANTGIQNMYTIFYTVCVSLLLWCSLYSGLQKTLFLSESDVHAKLQYFCLLLLYYRIEWSAKCWPELEQPFCCRDGGEEFWYVFCIL